MTPVRKKLRQDKKWYEEVSFGIRSIVRVGNSYGFIIPKYFFDREKVEYGEEMILIGLRRRRGVSDELTKAEQAEFERWRKLKDREKEIMEKALKEMDQV